MERTITFPAKHVGSIKAALTKRVGEVFEILTGEPWTHQTEDESKRDYHSMEMGRDLPPNSPFVDKGSSVSKQDGFEVRIRSSVAMWNPREASNCSFSAFLMDPDGNGVSMSGSAYETSSVSSARVSFRAGAELKAAELVAKIREIIEEA